MPYVVARYINYSRPELQIILFEMIHGRNRPGNRGINKRNDYKLPIKELWSEEVEHVLFQRFQ